MTYGGTPSFTRYDAGDFFAIDIRVENATDSTFSTDVTFDMA